MAKSTRYGHLLGLKVDAPGGDFTAPKLSADDQFTDQGNTHPVPTPLEDSEIEGPGSVPVGEEISFDIGMKLVDDAELEVVRAETFAGARHDVEFTYTDRTFVVKNARLVVTSRGGVEYGKRAPARIKGTAGLMGTGRPFAETLS